jgi:protein phosphatase 2C family protein 2/3
LFVEFALGQEQEIGDIERSGSCAIITLIVDDICYIANTGDSRAMLSVSGGKQVLTLSNDHKPTDPIEVQRILKSGG